jgi:hypothetical protein
VFDFVEVLGDLQGNLEDSARLFRVICNHVLKRESSAYRFVGKIISPVTNEAEINAIEDAAATDHDSLRPISTHIETALRLLSDRNKPDYRNSIKESISAVESLCRVIAGEKATLGQALKLVKEKVDLHPALEKGFSSLYGWTNDTGGIRHALSDESAACDFEDAKYMLVSCSAFVNYLIAKAAKAGVTLS